MTTFTILWPNGRALFVPAIDGKPDPNEVADSLPYRWRKAWAQTAGWREEYAGDKRLLFCALRNRRGRHIVTLYASETAPATYHPSSFGGGWIIADDDRVTAIMGAPEPLSAFGGALGYIVEPQDADDVMSRLGNLVARE